MIVEIKSTCDRCGDTFAQRHLTSKVSITGLKEYGEYLDLCPICKSSLCDALKQWKNSLVKPEAKITNLSFKDYIKGLFK